MGWCIWSWWDNNFCLLPYLGMWVAAEDPCFSASGPSGTEVNECVAIFAHPAKITQHIFSLHHHALLLLNAEFHYVWHHSLPISIPRYIKTTNVIAHHDTTQQWCFIKNKMIVVWLYTMNKPMYNMYLFLFSIPSAQIKACVMQVGADFWLGTCCSCSSSGYVPRKRA